MAKSFAPAFQFYPGDRLQELAPILQDDEAMAAWTRVFMYLWKAGPSPEERLASVAGKGWVKVGFLLQHVDGLFSLQWMEEKRTSMKEFSDKQAENGKKGGRPRSRPAKEENPSLSSGKPTEKPERSSSARKIEEEDTSTSSGKERVRKGPDPGVQGVIDHLTTRLQENDIAKGLDGDQKTNRWSARSLLLKLAKEYPEHDPLLTAKTLIDAALQDPFHRKNMTKVRYLLNNCNSIIASAKERRSNTKTQSNDDYQRGILEALARRQAERAAAGQPA